MLVTSAFPGDGKSTVAINLAVTAARYGLKVVLVDADMRRGGIHYQFGLLREPGLSQYLVGQEQLKEIVRRTPNKDTGLAEFDVITCGRYPPICSELLASEQMRTLLRQLLNEYDLVVIDSPPVNMVTDAALLAMYSDYIIFVVREFRTTRAALSYSYQVLQPEIPVGFVLNGVKIPRWIANFVGTYAGYTYYGYGDGDFGQEK